MWGVSLQLGGNVARVEVSTLKNGALKILKRCARREMRVEPMFQRTYMARRLDMVVMLAVVLAVRKPYLTIRI